MVRRWMFALCLCLCLCLWAAPAHAGEPAGVCANPDVIDTVAQQLRQAGIHGTVDGRNPGEVTLADGSGTSCAVWLVEPLLDTNRSGDRRPTQRVGVQNFHVQRLPHSLVVDLTGPVLYPAGSQAGPDDRFPGDRRRP